MIAHRCRIVAPFLLSASALLFSACATPTHEPASEATNNAATPEHAPKEESCTTVQFLSREALIRFANEQKDDSEQLNRAIDEAWPQLRDEKSGSQFFAAGIAADIAASATKEIVNWIGGLITDEAKKYTGDFCATIDDANWIVPGQKMPTYVAVQLTRETVAAGAAPKKVFTAVVLIRPVLRAEKNPAAAADNFDRFVCQFVPLYWRETDAVAQHSSNKLGAVLSIDIAGVWPTGSGDPGSAKLASYCLNLPSYELDHAIYFSDAKSAGHGETSFHDTSHFFVMPAHPAALTVTVGVVETDHSLWPKILAKVGATLSGEADAAASAVKSKIKS